MRTVLTAGFAIGLALILGAPAFAQDGQLAANIPFGFSVGDVKMPSGRCIVRSVNSNALQIRCADDKRSAVTITNEANTPRGLMNGRLVFYRYGDLYFLSEVSWPGGPSRALPKSANELETAKQFRKPAKLEVATK